MKKIRTEYEVSKKHEPIMTHDTDVEYEINHCYTIEIDGQRIIISDPDMSNRTHDLAIEIYKTVEQFYKDKLI